MIDLATLLSPSAILLDLKSGSKRQLLQDLAAHAARLTQADAAAILAALTEREKLGTTGLGEGIAIPHAKLAGLEQLTALFARLTKPIDFDALDDEPVDLVFLLLAPDEAGADHLKALARIARVLRDDEFCRALRAAPDAAAIHRLFAGEARASAA